MKECLRCGVSRMFNRECSQLIDHTLQPATRTCLIHCHMMTVSQSSQPPLVRHLQSTHDHHLKPICACIISGHRPHKDKYLTRIDHAPAQISSVDLSRQSISMLDAASNSASRIAESADALNGARCGCGVTVDCARNGSGEV